ncbi:crossover junction endodeoxyribonuclease RuvC [Wenzhouxiangella sp. XN79A]|uniref:crossover junction endodeoxyribonuclease RuvC n=1 Tax=Wenzhouxiangella sp. XN79A TaxID=2724193 RepID=UPI00144A6594|nr:crossover junction endodeoxyribonuclease RuvC [Wenzhouxiangella sp. XN79A]NKI35509.1 crossover junction endodeoxyribonuclease RuvC [Wenzhouxiangella sp. XN79A]
MRVLGIDPGSRVTGIGVVDGHTLVAAFDLKLGDGDMPGRLSAIFDGVREAVETHRPEIVAIETAFMSRNPQAAIKLGQARGAAICAAVQCGLDVHEYAPRLIKQALVGRGGADKEQVQHMVRMLLKTKAPFGADAADALAVALCHLHTAQTASRLPAGVRLR